MLSMSTSTDGTVRRTSIADPPLVVGRSRTTNVLRWEYRLGSTLYVVYSRSQNELGVFSDQAPTTALWPLRLGPGPTTDTFMLKWSWWFSA